MSKSNSGAPHAQLAQRDPRLDATNEVQSSSNTNLLDAFSNYNSLAQPFANLAPLQLLQEARPHPSTQTSQLPPPPTLQSLTLEHRAVGASRLVNGLRVLFERENAAIHNGFFARALVNHIPGLLSNNYDGLLVFDETRRVPTLTLKGKATIDKYCETMGPMLTNLTVMGMTLLQRLCYPESLIQHALSDHAFFAKITNSLTELITTLHNYFGKVMLQFMSAREDFGCAYNTLLTRAYIVYEALRWQPDFKNFVAAIHPANMSLYLCLMAYMRQYSQELHARALLEQPRSRQPALTIPNIVSQSQPQLPAIAVTRQNEAAAVLLGAGPSGSSKQNTAVLPEAGPSGSSKQNVAAQASGNVAGPSGQQQRPEPFNNSCTRTFKSGLRANQTCGKWTSHPSGFCNSHLSKEDKAKRKEEKAAANRARGISEISLSPVPGTPPVVGNAATSLQDTSRGVTIPGVEASAQAQGAFFTTYPSTLSDVASTQNSVPTRSFDFRMDLQSQAVPLPPLAELPGAPSFDTTVTRAPSANWPGDSLQLPSGLITPPLSQPTVSSPSEATSQLPDTQTLEHDEDNTSTSLLSASPSVEAPFQPNPPADTQTPDHDEDDLSPSPLSASSSVEVPSQPSPPAAKPKMVPFKEIFAGCPSSTIVSLEPEPRDEGAVDLETQAATIRELVEAAESYQGIHSRKRGREDSLEEALEKIVASLTDPAPSGVLESGSSDNDKTPAKRRRYK